MVQHYDVQPAAPHDLWTTPAYEPAVRDGRLYARGATDNKGEMMSRIWGIEAYLATIGPLPCRVRFLVEGEEESGSEHLDALLDERADLRRADGALIEGGSVDALGRPVLTAGARGGLSVELVARTLTYDAHSSLATMLPSAPDPPRAGPGRRCTTGTACRTGRAWRPVPARRPRRSWRPWRPCRPTTSTPSRPSTA